MKKTILLSTIFAVGAAFADGTDIQSSNAIGALNLSITNSAAQTLVAVPFLGYEAGSAVKVKDMVKTSNLGTGSKLYVPDGNGAYNTWTLNASGQWIADAKVTINANGLPTAGQSDSEDVTVKRGDAFWIEPVNAAGTIYLLGQDAEPGTSAVSPGWNLIGNASTRDVMYSKVADNFDQIVIQVAGKLRYYTYKSGKGWRYQKDNGAWCSDPPCIEAGQGLWYKAASGGTIQW